MMVMSVQDGGSELFFRIVATDPSSMKAMVSISFNNFQSIVSY